MPSSGEKIFYCGLVLYRKGYYWHAHRAFEYLWLRESEPESSFHKALVKLCGALLHAGGGNFSSCTNLLRGTLKHLDPLTESICGVDIQELKEALRTLLTSSLRAEAGERRSIDWRKKPRIVPHGVTLPRMRRCRPMDGPGGKLLYPDRPLPCSVNLLDLDNHK